MKKLFLSFIILFYCIKLSAQVQYSFPISSQFCDVPGESFLEAHTINNVTYISEIDSSGNHIWMDSIEFNHPGNIELRNLIKYQNLDKYLITVRKVDTIVIDSTNGFSYRHCFYQFIQISSQTQGITNQKVDTTIVPDTWSGWNPVIDTYNSYDNSNIMIYNNVENMTNDYIFEIDTNLILNEVPQIDTIFNEVSMRDLILNSTDTIRKMNYANDTSNVSFTCTSFSDSISIIRKDSFQIPADYDNNWILYSDFISNDSLLVFHQSYSTSPLFEVKLNLYWFDSQSNIVYSRSFYPPTNNVGIPYGAVGAIYSNEKIYYLGRIHRIGSFGEDIYEFAVVEYDKYFNLMCKIPIYLSVDDINQLRLVKINGLPYIQRIHDINYSPNNYFEYYPINNCNEVLNIEETQSIDYCLYPNPTNSSVQFANTNRNNLHITLYNSQGKIMKNFTSGNSMIDIDLSNYQNGFYFLQINDGNSATIKKIIKE